MLSTASTRRPQHEAAWHAPSGSVPRVCARAIKEARHEMWRASWREARLLGPSCHDMCERHDAGMTRATSDRVVGEESENWVSLISGLVSAWVRETGVGWRWAVDWPGPRARMQGVRLGFADQADGS